MRSRHKSNFFNKMRNKSKNFSSSHWESVAYKSPVRRVKWAQSFIFLPLRLFHLSLRRLLLKVTSFISVLNPSLCHTLLNPVVIAGYEMFSFFFFPFCLRLITYLNGVNVFEDDARQFRCKSRELETSTDLFSLFCLEISIPIASLKGWDEGFNQTSKFFSQ